MKTKHLAGKPSMGPLGIQESIIVGFCEIFLCAAFCFCVLSGHTLLLLFLLFFVVVVVVSNSVRLLSITTRSSSEANVRVLLSCKHSSHTRLPALHWKQRLALSGSANQLCAFADSLPGLVSVAAKGKGGYT